MRRSLLKLTRLAVTLATQPPSKCSLALAMSSRPESTGTPTASTAASGAPTSSWIRSMSWIIRSSTTSTSVPRGWNGAMRCDSTNSGRSITSPSASTAALKRSRWPTWRMRCAPGGERDQRVGLGEARRDRLLDQHVQAALQQAARDREVRAGRHRDARGIDPPDQSPAIGQRQDAQPLSARRAPPPRRDRPPRPAVRPRRRAYFSAWWRPKWPQPTTPPGPAHRCPRALAHANAGTSASCGASFQGSAAACAIRSTSSAHDLGEP